MLSAHSNDQSLANSSTKTAGWGIAIERVLAAQLPGTSSSSANEPTAVASLAPTVDGNAAFKPALSDAALAAHRQIAGQCEP